MPNRERDERDEEVKGGAQQNAERIRGVSNDDDDFDEIDDLDDEEDTDQEETF